MKILVITKSPWDDKLSSGNTLSNLFSNWGDTEFACIYCRDAAPNNIICSRYLSISPLNVMKNILSPWCIGRSFSSGGNASDLSSSVERSLSTKKKNNRLIFALTNELVYVLGRWQNGKYKAFIKGFSPDVVFAFGIPEPVIYYTLKYAKRYTSAVLVTYFVDDVYHSGVKITPIKAIERKRLRKIVSWSDKCYGISQLMCDEYSDIFGKQFSLLYKGCEKREPKTSFNKPIHFVYAGNLLFGRHDSLRALALAIQSVNECEQKAFLDIFSGTPVADEIRNSLNIEGSSRLNPSIPFEKVKEIMHESDIVLHVESFDKAQMAVVRLSFSTKITDCMQSGTVMMAIGPRDIASIDYVMKSIPGAIVVNSINNIEQVVHDIVENPEQLSLRAKAINEFANEKAEIGKVRMRLHRDFEDLINTNE
ncbi:MAG: hypothetical protein MJY89_00085 [Bacteroidales bacterium]|nr:hypothetical protein [Bacteroidales bacterium]